MKKSGMEQRMEMYLQNVELGTENNRLNARIAELEAALEAKHQQYTGAVIQLEEARTHGEQYRKNWLALQAATGEDCQLHALDVIREARKDGERLKKVLYVLATYEGSALGCNPQILFTAISDAARGAK